jgi:hypothetical protein
MLTIEVDVEVTVLGDVVDDVTDKVEDALLITLDEEPLTVTLLEPEADFLITGI